MRTATAADMETARRRILERREAVLAAGGPLSQELAGSLWRDALALEHAAMKRRWGR